MTFYKEPANNFVHSKVISLTKNLPINEILFFWLKGEADMYLLIKKKKSKRGSQRTFKTPPWVGVALGANATLYLHKILALYIYMFYSLTISLTYIKYPPPSIG